MLSKRFLKRGVWLLLPILALFFCGACSIEITPKTQPTQTKQSGDAAAELDSLNIDTYITLDDGNTAITGHGAAFENGVLIISQSGTYSIKGSLSDGRIVVNVSEEGKVKLLLDGAEIHSTAGAPIYIENSPKETKILLAKDSDNTLEDAAPKETSEDSDLFDAVVYSKDDLEIGGLGTLTITANAKGVLSKDDLQISGGTLKITSGGDGLRGKDSLEISGGSLELTAGGDGLRTSNEEKGSLLVSGGTITIESAKDAVQSAGDLTVSGGTLDLTAGGGYDQSKGGAASFAKAGSDESDGVSAKGLKAEGSVTVSGGTLTLNCLDDAINADQNVTISGGTLTISSNDDAVHADSSITVSGGTVKIQTAYEGMEATAITVCGGELDITATDDGINAASADDQSETSFFSAAQGAQNGDAASQTPPERPDGANGQTPPEGFTMPEGMEPPEGFSMPEGMTPPNGENGEFSFPNGMTPPNGAPGGDQNGERPTRPDNAENAKQGDRQSQGGFGFSRQAGSDKGGGMDRYDEASRIEITGGSVKINAGGDGVDTNGDIKMTGGSLTVFGPTNNGNGAIDYAGSFEMTGGTLLAVGSAGMSQGVSKGLASLRTNCSAEANAEIEIRNANGKTLALFTTPKQIANIVFASGDLTAGESYTILVGGEQAATTTAK